MKARKSRTLMCDFETTVYDQQEYTEVWASACVEFYTEDVKIHHSIAETFDYFKSLNCNITAYYHNLKFDGSFWIDYLLNRGDFTQGFVTTHAESSIRELDLKAMPNNSFKYSISAMGQWYTITIKTGGHIIELRDSLKLLPFSVKKIGESFHTKHQKLEMEYKGFRYAGCKITDEEKEYIANDVLVVKEALEMMFNDGHKRLTIGSCCLAEYKEICRRSTSNMLDYDEMFPDLTTIKIDPAIYGSENVDQYIRKSYKGGWCYLVEGKENQLKGKGTTADVNSLYPSMMHSESGNRYPVGIPTFWQGNFIPDEAKRDNCYYFVRIKTRFRIKEGKLPFIQIKHSYLYKATEMLKTSDVYDPVSDKYVEYWVNEDGTLESTAVELTLTMTDYQLILEHYDLMDCEILDGCWFWSSIGIFDEYIDFWAEIKKNSTGARREEAKLFLNNLYGKMASSTDSSYKVAYLKEDGVVGFKQVKANEKNAGYIAVGSAITSYARNFTIRAAQMNYYGVDKRGFIYADTDSIHCDLEPEEIKGIKVHDKNFCCWKLEACWDKAIFVRQKTYIEHVTHENLIPVEELKEPKKPYHNIKCAGMPKRCKDLFEMSLDGTAKHDNDAKRTPEELRFLFKDNGKGKPIIRTYNDFKVGLIVPGKLLPKRIKGGILLKETTYEMR